MVVWMYIRVGGYACSIICCFLFFFKQKTAYEMRISDWSSDVCSSDLLHRATARLRDRDDLSAMLVTANGRYFSAGIDLHSPLAPDPAVTSPSRFRRWYRQGVGSLHQLGDEWEAVEKPVVVAFQGPCLGGALEIGRASCRGRGCRYV